MTKQTFSLLNRFWRNKPVRWSLLGILLPVSGVMTAYAVTEPLPQPSLYQAERITQELPAVYVDSGAYQGSYWAEEAVEPGDTLTDVLTRLNVPQASIKSVLAKSPIDTKL